MLKQLQTDTGEQLTGEALVDAVSRFRTEAWEAGHNEGYQEGYQTAEEEQSRAFSAALALALHNDLGFDREQIMAVQNACNREVSRLDDALIEETLREYLTEVHYEGKDDSDVGAGCKEGDTDAEPQT